MDYVREDLKEKNIQKLPGLVKRSKNKQKGSLEESCESLIVSTADGREERRRLIIICSCRNLQSFNTDTFSVIYYYHTKDMHRAPKISRPNRFRRAPILRFACRACANTNWLMYLDADTAKHHSVA